MPSPAPPDPVAVRAALAELVNRQRAKPPARVALVDVPSEALQIGQELEKQQLIVMVTPEATFLPTRALHTHARTHPRTHTHTELFLCVAPTATAFIPSVTPQALVHLVARNVSNCGWGRFSPTWSGLGRR